MLLDINLCSPAVFLLTFAWIFADSVTGSISFEQNLSIRTTREWIRKFEWVLWQMRSYKILQTLYLKNKNKTKTVIVRYLLNSLQLLWTLSLNVPGGHFLHIPASIKWKNLYENNTENSKQFLAEQLQSLLIWGGLFLRFLVGSSPSLHSVTQKEHSAFPHRYPALHPHTVSLLIVQGLSVNCTPISMQKKRLVLRTMSSTF